MSVVAGLLKTNTGSVHKYNGLKDPATDAIIEQTEVTLDRNERIKLVKDTQIALLEKYTPFLITHNFFFQAEDGIRDLTVTGVQTCALPICSVACAVLTGALQGLWQVAVVWG